MVLWQSVVLAAVVSTLTLLASLLGMQVQLREQRRVRAHDLDRESQLRLHTDRVASYTAFYREGGNVRHALRRRTDAPDDQVLKASAAEHRAALWQACTSVTLVGSPEAALAAWDLQYPDAPDTPAVPLWEQRRATKALAETEDPPPVG